MQKSIDSLAIVIPAFNEAEGLEALFAALKRFREAFPLRTVKAIFVDDHSDDETPEILRQACEKTDWFSYIRLSRRSGSHIAIIAGLAQAREDCAVFLSADLQDPPELVPQMIDLCRQGHDIVWAVRDGRDGQSFFEALWSSVFHTFMRSISNVGELPFQCSFALLSRRAYAGLVSNASPFPSLLVDIPRLGFSVKTVPFKKPARAFGRSKWNLRRKIKLLMDSIVTASYAPLHAMIYLGICVSGIGFAYAFFLIVRHVFFGESAIIQGWTSLMVVVLVLGGIQMLMTGLIGEYLWRTSESARRRELYFIEEQGGLPQNDDAN